MPTKQNNISWRASDEAELSRVVRNYNAKINRIINKNPQLKDVLPEKISKREIKNKIETRAEFNKSLKSAQRFTRKGSEEVLHNKYGLQITKYERKEIAIKLGIVNRKRTAERKQFGNLDVINQGKKTGFKRIEVDSLRMGNLKKKTFNFDRMSKENYKKFVESLNKQSETKYTTLKQIQWRENYIKSIVTAYGSKGNAIIDKIRSLDINSVITVLFENENASIEFNYTALANAIKLEIVSDIWLSM